VLAALSAGGSCAIGFILRLLALSSRNIALSQRTHSVGDHTVLFTSLMDVRSSNRFCCRTFGEDRCVLEVQT